MHRLPDADRMKRLSSDEVRAAFLIRGLFAPGRLALRHIDLDRVIVGAAVPMDVPIRLDAPAWLAADYFMQRREMGVLNIGGAGHVQAGGSHFDVQPRDMVYVGRGARDIAFSSEDETTPARFFLVSYPAHAAHPSERVAYDEADLADLGAAEQANERQIAKYIHPGRVASAQLVMGVTTLAPGSVWNTMPAHRHLRRTEVYLYFDLPDDAAVIHLVGEPGETRHVVVRNEEVVLSPAWSIHSGCGTQAYSFCWAMGGENQDFADMQAVDMRELK